MDVVIIGSGLGGLSCGVILAKNGYRVTVLEKEAVIGGCLQCFTRRGRKFETGMHFIGSASEGQTLSNMMRYLEISDKVKLSPLDPHAYDIVCIDGKRYNFAIGREAFIAQMASYFPHQKENLERYYDIVEEVANASSVHSLKHAEDESAISMEYQLRSINEVISSVITDPLLQKVLVGNLPLYAAEKDKTPFSTHAFIMDFYNQSSYRIAGGSETIAMALKDTIERYGGEVLTRSEVTAVKCNDEGRAYAVVVNGQEERPVDYVISAIHPQRLFEMTEAKQIRPVFRKRIASIPNTVSGFTVYIDFKEGAMPYMNSNFYGYNCGTPWDCEQYDEQSWPKGYLYMHLCHEDGAQYAQAGEIISYMWMKDVQKWMGTQPGHRGADYEEFKRQKAELLLDSVEREFPGFRDTIKCYYTSTPLTYFNYTGTTDGSMYGVVKDINMGPAYRIPHRTKIPNLLLTGQNINSHGMLGVLVGTIVTCSELLTAKTIYEQIINSNQ